MATADILFGADLRLLGDLERQSDRYPGSDLSLVTRPVSARPESDPVDLETLSGSDNLVQALLLRLRTRQGELAVLGHPDYGSRLWELIGELNTPANRNLAKLYTLEALSADPRVQRILAIDVRPAPADRTRVEVRVALQAIGAPTPLNLVFALLLAGSSVS